MRAALEGLERVVVYCRTESSLRAFCEQNDCEPGDSHRDAAECDVVVTVTSSRDPVLRGDWLGPGALVCAVGANDGRRRELDNVVLERASAAGGGAMSGEKRQSHFLRAAGKA